MNKVFFIFILCLFGLCVARLDRRFYKENASFSLGFIYPTNKSLFDYPTKHLPEEQLKKISHILSQPFLYWKKGKQSFVFLSADQRYVLKFCRLPAYLRPYTLKRNPYQRFKVTRLAKTLTSFHYVFNYLQKEAHLLYANLSLAQPVFDQSVLLIDQLNVCHRVNLNNLPWLLQECGEPFYAYLEKQDEAGAISLIDKVIALYTRCWENDLIDTDVIFDKNFGVFQDEPMLLDLGQFKKGAQTLSLQAYLLKETASLCGYLQKTSPSLYDYYMESIASKKSL